MMKIQCCCGGARCSGHLRAPPRRYPFSGEGGVCAHWAAYFQSSGQWSVASECEADEIAVTEKRQNEANFLGVLIVAILGVSNGPGGYNFFGQEGTSPKSVGFGGLVPAPCQSCFFPRIDLMTLLIGLKMASAVGAHFTGQGPSGHCLVVKRAELPAGNSSRVHPRHLPGRDPPSVWFTLDEH